MIDFVSRFVILSMTESNFVTDRVVELSPMDKNNGESEYTWYKMNYGSNRKFISLTLNVTK